MVRGGCSSRYVPASGGCAASGPTAATRGLWSVGCARSGPSAGRTRLAIVARDPQLKYFAVLPKRWIVERTFAWLNRYRRLSPDYERTTSSSAALVYVAMIRLMTHRLAINRTF